MFVRDGLSVVGAGFHAGRPGTREGVVEMPLGVPGPDGSEEDDEVVVGGGRDGSWEAPRLQSSLLSAFLSARSFSSLSDRSARPSISPSFLGVVFSVLAPSRSRSPRPPRTTPSSPVSGAALRLGSPVRLVDPFRSTEFDFVRSYESAS